MSAERAEQVSSKSELEEDKVFSSVFLSSISDDDDDDDEAFLSALLSDEIDLAPSKQ